MLEGGVAMSRWSLYLPLTLTLAPSQTRAETTTPAGPGGRAGVTDSPEVEGEIVLGRNFLGETPGRTKPGVKRGNFKGDG